MDDSSDPDRAFTGASPWPLVVALGLTLSEIGVVLGLRPISVAGLLLFVGSVAGILTESGYISRPARAIGVQGFGLVGIGLALILQNRTGITVRGQSIALAGTLCLVGAPLWAGYVRRNAPIRSPTPESSDPTKDRVHTTD